MLGAVLCTRWGCLRFGSVYLHFAGADSANLYAEEEGTIMLGLRDFLMMGIREKLQRGCVCRVA